MQIENIETDFDLEPFFTLSHDYLCIASFDGYFKKINPAFIKMIGYTPEELYNTPISHFVHPEDRLNTAVTRAKILEGVPLLNFENRYITKTNAIVWLTWTSIPVADKQLIYAISKNITHLKKLEEDRHFRIKDLTSVNSGLTNLSYTTSHDLRSPVNNLIALVELLDRSNIHDEETLLYLNLIDKAAHKLKDTLNEQVDHLKENLLLKPRIDLVNLKDVINNIIDSLGSLIENSGTTFNIDLEKVEFLKVNKFYLHSIFLNLITNAIKFSKPGVSPEITISSKKLKKASVIQFSDNGIGIDLENKKDNLFELHQVFTDNKDSKGIGLYLVKSYMHSLGGDIEIKSKLNVGTSFKLTFKD